jgi:hypothetical protein
MSNKEDFLELIPQESAPRLHPIDREHRETNWPVYWIIRCPSHVRDLYRSEQDDLTVIQNRKRNLYLCWIFCSGGSWERLLSCHRLESR